PLPPAAVERGAAGVLLPDRGGGPALAAGAGGAGAGAFAPSAGSEGRLAVALALALAGATLAWLILLAVRAGSVARILGILSVPLSVALLVAFARTVPEPLGSTVFQLLAGALFTG